MTLEAWVKKLASLRGVKNWETAARAGATISIGISAFDGLFWVSFLWDCEYCCHKLWGATGHGNTLRKAHRNALTELGMSQGKPVCYQCQRVQELKWLTKETEDG